MVIDYSLTLKQPKKYLIIFCLALILGAIILFAVKLSKSEKVDYAIIKEKICNNQNISPEELTQMIEFLAKSEDIDFTNVDDIKKNLCINISKQDWVFPVEKELKKLVGDVHKIKIYIIKQNEKWCKMIRAKNPDIGYNKKTGKLVLKNPISKKTIETDVLFDSFLK